MENMDEQNRKQLEKVVLDYLETYALSYEEVDEGEYEYIVKDLNDKEDHGINLGIYIDDDGQHYLMYLYIGPFDVTEEQADTLAQQMSCLLNTINSIESGTAFYLDRMGSVFSIYAEQGHDTFDGMPTKEGLSKRFHDLLLSATGAAPLIERVLGGEDAEDVLDDVFEELGEEDDWDDEDEEEDEDDEDGGDVIPFPFD